MDGNDLEREMPLVSQSVTSCLFFFPVSLIEFGNA